MSQPTKSLENIPLKGTVLNHYSKILLCFSPKFFYCCYYILLTNLSYFMEIYKLEGTAFIILKQEKTPVVSMLYHWNLQCKVVAIAAKQTCEWLVTISKVWSSLIETVITVSSISFPHLCASSRLSLSGPMSNSSFSMTRESD